MQIGFGGLCLIIFNYAMLAMPQNSTIIFCNVKIMLELCFGYCSNKPQTTRLRVAVHRK